MYVIRNNNNPKKRRVSSFGANGKRLKPMTTTATTTATRTVPHNVDNSITLTPSSLSSASMDGGAESNVKSSTTRTTFLTSPSTSFVYRKKTTARSSAVLCSKKSSSSSSPRRMLIQRAPMFPGLSLHQQPQKKFQRPMLKRRAYDQRAQAALTNSSLGPKKRMDGMAKLMARAGKGLQFQLPKQPSDEKDGEFSSDDEEEEEEEEEDRPFEPLCVWESPEESGDAENCLLPQDVPKEQLSSKSVFVPPILAKWLRPHQREGVLFLYQCVMGLKSSELIRGCILADDMGLGKTLQSVTLIYTLLKTSISKARANTAQRVIVVCPCSLVKNWDHEFVKWLKGDVKTLALAESDRKSVEKNIDVFVRTRMFNVLILSYETIRTHIKRFVKHGPQCCDLLVCDEAHRLKNRDNQTSRALSQLPCRRRVLLTGTPMQNDLSEFYAMVDFTNPGILGTPQHFQKKIQNPIQRGREPDATERETQRMLEIQSDISATVNEFILRRINTLNAQHLPPKLVQVVCCRLTPIQQNMYQHLVNTKELQHVLEGKQANCLGYIQMLMKLCNHPRLIVQDNNGGGKNKPVVKATSRNARRGGSEKKISYNDDDYDDDFTGKRKKKKAKAAGTSGSDMSKFLPAGDSKRVLPEWSGKMFVLYRLMKEMRTVRDKIVIVSNYTQTLDLIGMMCRENSWGFCRLDGSIAMKKRQKMVEEFNDPNSSLIAFLLSSKAGGCGLNLIGGNRLVLFDPDWNPAVDKQAAARCWRDGQKKRCFTYRFLATGTVEEKIFQRQLSKEGLQSVVDDKEQVNSLSTKDLRNLFKYRSGTPSDTHDKLQCKRCKIIADDAEAEAKKVLPKKLAACQELLDRMMEHDDAKLFLKPMDPTEHEVSSEEYENLVKQPMDLGTIKTRLGLEAGASQAYRSASGFSKDVNRIFENVVKVWSPGNEVADAARRLQGWWVQEWTQLVPKLMAMKADGEAKASADNVGGDHDATCMAVGAENERGDNYQEQIGMPEEEDMRNWSHHHSADTVDDPIFRAAMRGYDNVSFVFGLEVTWSLIQQRQQEEEERKLAAEQANAECGSQKKECAAKLEGEAESESDSSSDGDDEENNHEEESGNENYEEENDDNADLSVQSSSNEEEVDDELSSP